MSFHEDSAAGLEALLDPHPLDVFAAAGVALVGLATLVLGNVRHPALCPCPNCDPPGTGWVSIPMGRDDMFSIVQTWSRRGPRSFKMGDYHYHLPVPAEAADSAQMALARENRLLDRRALVDRLYLELTDANPELEPIPIRDPRARHWVVVGALSGLHPRAIDSFVRESTG